MENEIRFNINFTSDGDLSDRRIGTFCLCDKFNAVIKQKINREIKTAEKERTQKKKKNNNNNNKKVKKFPPKYSNKRPS